MSIALKQKVARKAITGRTPTYWPLPFFNDPREPANIFDGPWSIFVHTPREHIPDFNGDFVRDKAYALLSHSGSIIGHFNPTVAPYVAPRFAEAMNGAMALRKSWDFESIDCVRRLLDATTILAIDIKTLVEAKHPPERGLGSKLKDVMRGADCFNVTHAHARGWYTPLQRVPIASTKLPRLSGDHYPDVRDQDWVFRMDKIGTSVAPKFNILCHESRRVIFSSALDRGDYKNLAAAGLFGKLMADTMRLARNLSSNPGTLACLAEATSILVPLKQYPEGEALDLIVQRMDTATQRAAENRSFQDRMKRIKQSAGVIRQMLNVLRSDEDRLSAILSPAFDRDRYYRLRRTKLEFHPPRQGQLNFAG